MNNANDKQRKALGKGLSALLPGRGSPSACGGRHGTCAAAPAAATPSTLPIDAIQPNPMQPRTSFKPDRLEELAASIRANGIIQPLIVRRMGDSYQIVAGERRWRAAKLAGLAEVPVVVQDVADPQMLEIGADREHPARRPEPHRNRARLRAAWPRAGALAGRNRPPHRQGSDLDHQHRPSAEAAQGSSAPGGGAAPFDGTCARDSWLADADEQIQIAEKAAAQGLSVRQVEALVQEMTADRRKPAQARERVGSGSERQGRRGGTGARPGNAGPDRRAERAARPDRDRILLASRSGPALSADCRRKVKWCRRQDSNLRPTDYETVALTT